MSSGSSKVPQWFRSGSPSRVPWVAQLSLCGRNTQGERPAVVLEKKGPNMTSLVSVRRHPTTKKTWKKQWQSEGLCHISHMAHGSFRLEPTWPQSPKLGAKMAPRHPTWSQHGQQTPNLQSAWWQDPQLAASIAP